MISIMPKNKYEIVAHIVTERAPSAFGTSPKYDDSAVGFGGGRAADTSKEESAVREMGEEVLVVKAI